MKNVLQTQNVLHKVRKFIVYLMEVFFLCVKPESSISQTVQRNEKGSRVLKKNGTYLLSCINEYRKKDFFSILHSTVNNETQKKAVVPEFQKQQKCKSRHKWKEKLTIFQIKQYIIKWGCTLLNTEGKKKFRIGWMQTEQFIQNIKWNQHKDKNKNI